MLKSTIKFDSIQLKEENGQFLVTFLEGDKPLFFNTSKMPDFKNGDNFSIVGIDGSMEYTLGGK